MHTIDITRGVHTIGNILELDACFVFGTRLSGMSRSCWNRLTKTESKQQSVEKCSYFDYAHRGYLGNK